MGSLPPSSRSIGRFDLRGARARLMVSIALAGLTAAVIPSSVSLEARAVAAWDAFAVTLIALVFWIIGSSKPADTCRRASAQDPGRTAVWVFLLACTTFSLFSSAVLLRRARLLPGAEGHLLSGLGLVAVAASWVVAHLGFTLRYAHLYYREQDGEGGIDFPGGEKPDDFDFAYFAFTLGMCFQVSDAVVTSRLIRRTVLMHAVLSFAYNTVILALALNLIFGLLG